MASIVISTTYKYHCTYERKLTKIDAHSDIMFGVSPVSKLSKLHDNLAFFSIPEGNRSVLKKLDNLYVVTIVLSSMRKKLECWTSCFPISIIQGDFSLIMVGNDG